MRNKKYYTKDGNQPEIRKIEEDPVVEQAGKKIHWKQFTKEANVDVEIYPTLEKYKGILPESMFDNKAWEGEIESFGDKRTVEDRRIALDNMWLSMPLELRRQYGHNKDAFLEDLPNLDKKIKQARELEIQKAKEIAKHNIEEPQKKE